MPIASRVHIQHVADVGGGLTQPAHGQIGNGQRKVAHWNRSTELPYSSWPST